LILWNISALIGVHIIAMCAITGLCFKLIADKRNTYDMYCKYQM